MIVIHDLTDDSAALLAAARTIGAGQLKSKFSPVGVKPETAQTAENWVVSARKTELTEDLRRELVKEAFQGIAQHLQGNPARKNLVWISPIFPTLVTGFDPALMAAERDAINPIPGAMLPVPQFANPESYYDQLRALVRQMSNANISLYPMDAKGLMTGSVINLQGERNFMDLLASETGGRAFYDTNTLDEDLRDVVEEGIHVVDPDRREHRGAILGGVGSVGHRVSRPPRACRRPRDREARRADSYRRP